MKKIKWRNAREEYPKEYQDVACILYFEKRTHNKWYFAIGVFDPSETYRHEEHNELWEWARIETGFDDWTRYANVKYWCPKNEFLKYIRSTI